MDRQSRVWKKYFIRALIAANLLKLAPFVRMVGLNGSMVRGKFSEKSDIDFLIITEKNRIFTTRLLVTLIIWSIRLKRSDKKTAGVICLNRFATVNNLEIKPNNHYHAWTFSKLMPLYEEKGIYGQFIDNNLWMNNYGFPPVKNRIYLTSHPLQLLIKSSAEFILLSKPGDLLENFVEKQQRKRINRKLEESLEDWNVKVDKNELCFHIKI